MIRREAARKRLSGIVLALAFAGIPALAAGEHIGFEPSYWDQAMSGTIRMDGSTLPGTEVDLQDGLGLQENDKLPVGVFWMHWLKRNYLIFSMAHSKRDGDQTLTSPLVVNDQVFQPGEEVSSRVETDLKSLYYGYNFLDTRLVQVGFRLGVDRLGFDTSMESRTTPTRASDSASATFPVAGLGVWFEPIPLLRFVAELNGSGGHMRGNDVNFYDGRIQAEIYWWRSFAVTVGYRRVKIDAEVESFGAAHVNQKGPYAGFVFRF